MNEVISWVTENWAGVGVIALAFHTFLKAIRDAIDKTPETDDNFFERAVSVIGKAIAYMFGKRA